MRILAAVRAPAQIRAKIPLQDRIVHLCTAWSNHSGKNGELRPKAGIVG